MYYKQIAVSQVSESGFQVESKVEDLMYPLTEERSELIGRLSELGLQADCSTGRIMYKEDFQPLPLNYTFVFVRHGQTFANQEHEGLAAVVKSGVELSEGDSSALEALESLGINPVLGRHYQGNVNLDRNQLNPFGIGQAEACKVRLHEVESGSANLEFPAAVKANTEGVRSNVRADMSFSGWVPDRAFSSPLGRAYYTGVPYIESKKELGMSLEVLEGLREMDFGVIDNRQVNDPEIADNPCHRFYREQDALWQADGDGSESFSSMLLRASSVLKGINDIISESGDNNIIVFSHSMFGAACSVLTGNGIVMESEEGPHIAFDKSGVTFPHCTPTVLHVHKD